MAVKTNELKASMVRKGYTQKKLADELQITQATLIRKLKNGVFRTDEVQKMIAVLEINEPMKIFFAD